MSSLGRGLADLLCSVQSLSRVQLFVTPWTASHQASLSLTNSWSLLKLISIELAMPSNHLILCHPLLCPPSIFPSIMVFSNESDLLCIVPIFVCMLPKQEPRFCFNCTQTFLSLHLACSQVFCFCFSLLCSLVFLPLLLLFFFVFNVAKEEVPLVNSLLKVSWLSHDSENSVP